MREIEVVNLRYGRFRVYVGGEFERYATMIGIIRLCCNYTDWEDKEIEKELMKLKKKGEIIIDDNISVRYNTEL